MRSVNLPLDKVPAELIVCISDVKATRSVSRRHSGHAPNEVDHLWKPQVSQRRRTLKQNMKKSLSDRVSCWVLGCGDVAPRRPSKTLLPPCNYRYVRLV